MFIDVVHSWNRIIVVYFIRVEDAKLVNVLDFWKYEEEFANNTVVLKKTKECGMNIVMNMMADIQQDN